MKRTAISNITPEEAMDELTMMEIKKLIQKARRSESKADEALREVYKAIDDMCIDLDAPTKAENAENLGEAISCYVQYGEYTLKGLLAEIRSEYTKINHED